MLPARVVMALPVFVRVNVPPTPKSSSPVAVIGWLCVTVPVVLKVRSPLVVIPTVFTVPMAKPLFSRKLTVPVLPARVVMAFVPAVRSNVPAPRSSRPAAERVLVPSWLIVAPFATVRVMFPVVNNASTTVDELGAREIAPPAFVEPKESALIDPKVLLFAIVIFFPGSLSVSK